MSAGDPPEDADFDPVPVIIDCLPYRKRDGLKSRDEEMYPYFAGHGYAALRIDLRGTGDSEGLPDDEYTPAELQRVQFNRQRTAIGTPRK